VADGEEAAAEEVAGVVAVEAGVVEEADEEEVVEALADEEEVAEASADGEAVGEEVEVDSKSARNSGRSVSILLHACTFLIYLLTKKKYDTNTNTIQLLLPNAVVGNLPMVPQRLFPKRDSDAKQFRTLWWVTMVPQ